MDETDVEDIEINLFLEALFQRYGYDFRQYARATIRRRLHRILARLDYERISELLPAVLHNESLAQKIIADFSITVTEMFRDPLFYQSLRTEVIPYLKTFPFIKIWHAGCATGEEVYSLAILLQEEGIYDQTTIFATDFNEDALRQAKEGIYSLRDLRQYTDNYQKGGGTGSFADYYHARYELAQINRNLQQNITFANHNLVTDGVFSEVHLILCRNVLIYFDRPLQNRVTQLLYDSLIHGGFLCLGMKETVHFSTVADHFRPVDEATRIFQKQT